VIKGEEQSGQWVIGKNGFFSHKDERDACGVGFVADLHGRRSHSIVQNAVTILDNLVHRGAAGGDGKTGDGAGILLQLPCDFFA